MGILSGAGNPLLTEERFRVEAYREENDVMTVEGTAARTLLLLGVLIAAAVWPWSALFADYRPGNAMRDLTSLPIMNTYIIGGAVVGFILAMIISFVPKSAPYLSVPYAFCEGVFLGAVSGVFEMMYPGIVIQASAGTLGVLMVMVAGYSFGILKASAKLRALLLSAGGAVMLVYLAGFVLNLCGFMPEILKSMLWGSGWLGIGFSAVVCLVAAFFLIFDFDMIERGAAAGAPKYMAWYSAFSLLVTLVWLYLEILRLLGKTRNRD